jgi:rhomboid protease GluP
MDLSTFKDYIKKHPITFILLLLNTMMLFIVIFTGGFTNFNLVRWGAIFPPLIIDNQEFNRLIAAMFLHGSIPHYLFNSVALYYLGGHMERLIGPRWYVVLYMGSGLLSSLLVTYLGDLNAVTIGASGAIFGIMGGLFMLTIKQKKWFHPRTIRSIQQLMVMNLVITFLVPNISILGHLGGLMMGLAILFFFTPKYPYFYVQQMKQ